MIIRQLFRFVFEIIVGMGKWCFVDKEGQYVIQECSGLLDLRQVAGTLDHAHDRALDVLANESGEKLREQRIVVLDVLFIGAVESREVHRDEAVRFSKRPNDSAPFVRAAQRPCSRMTGGPLPASAQ
ncbi:MAG: hypothetical protein OEV41_00645 [Gammaproteobacteria bacterium]|nr:hypothetical protein [Gammaproteobacteria bacterium]